MGERERLALFNMISECLNGATVLDAYAGSGALGFEALSRGAKEVLFIDSSAKAESCILDNMLALGYFEFLGSKRSVAEEIYRNAIEKKPALEETADVIRMKVSQFESDRLFDIVLADPPYNHFVLADIEYLVKFIKKDGLLVLSHPDEPPVFLGLDLQKSKKYAGATISIYVKP